MINVELGGDISQIYFRRNKFKIEVENEYSKEIYLMNLRNMKDYYGIKIKTGNFSQN